jgi:hypothetical protein
MYPNWLYDAQSSRLRVLYFRITGTFILFISYLKGFKYMCSCAVVSFIVFFSEAKYVTENFAFNSVQKVVVNGQFQQGCFLIV